MMATQTFAQLAGAWLRKNKGAEVSSFLRLAVRNEVEDHQDRTKGAALAKPLTKDQLLKRAIPNVLDELVDRILVKQDFQHFIGELLAKLAGEWVHREPLEPSKLDITAGKKKGITMRARLVGQEVEADQHVEVPATTSTNELTSMVKALGGKLDNIEWGIKKVDAGYGGGHHVVYDLDVTFPIDELPTMALGADAINAAADKALGTGLGEFRELIGDLRSLIV